MYAPLCQYITSLLSSTPPPLATTSPLKVRVEYSCGSVEYTTACSTNITLRLSPAIQENYTDPSMESAGVLWAALEKLYGKPGVIATYLEFRAAIKTKMSDHEDPSLCIDKTITHLTRVITAGLDVPEHFQAMILMAKLPPSMDSIAQVMCQEDNVQKLDLAKIRRMTSLVWEQRQGKKAPPRQNANKC